MENAAKELGITTEELADRIVPSLDFAPDGTRIFDYGPRKFVVRLTPSLELAVNTDAGKAVKTMPAPGKTDDAEKAAAAYETYKALKKQIKTTVTAQRARLELALSAQRCWDTDTWRKLFVENPIMHQFAISLIWGVYENGELKETFRYMEDGSFNTADEEEYSLTDGANIGLVHPIELNEDTLNTWKQQLEDYEITQSIQQLSRPVFRRNRPRLPPWKRWQGVSSVPCPSRANFSLTYKIVILRFKYFWYIYFFLDRYSRGGGYYINIFIKSIIIHKVF